MDNKNFPLGADNSDAPWNKAEVKPQEVEVTVSMTMSKTMKIPVYDYAEIQGIDENGDPCINYDFTNCDLVSAVENSGKLPTDNVCGDWYLDDLEVVKE